MRNIVVIANTYRQVFFFYRMRKTLLDMGYDMIFIVGRFSSYFFLKSKGMKVKIIRKFYKKNNIKKLAKKLIEYGLQYSIECKMNRFSIEEGMLVYESVWSMMEEVYHINGIDKIFIWNGSSISGIVATDFSRKMHIERLYFEISNIPGKIFVDKLGTNSNSQLYINREILNQYESKICDYEEWKRKYLNSKLKKHIVPQKRTLIDSFSLANILDAMGSIIYRDGEIKIPLVKNKILILLKNFKKSISYDVVDYTSIDYVFYPLQVSYDSQILLHSDVGIEAGLLYAIDFAKRNDWKLIVKPHPQEKDAISLKKILALKEKYHFYIINENSFKLIKYAKKVITINSTIGLESMIMKKEIEVLGKAYYKNFNDDELSRYISGYLIDVDFFSKDDITKNEMREILGRIS